MEVDDVNLQLQLNDSSEYSDELQEDDSWQEDSYLFAERAAEVGDFDLVEFE